MQVCQFSASSSLQFLRRRILNIFFEKFIRYAAPSTNQIKLFGQKSKVCNMEDYSINISVKKNQISPVRQQKLSISSFPIISLWEL